MSQRGEHELRALLAEQRADAERQRSTLRRDLDGLLAAADSTGTDDEHDPEGVTIAVERANLAGLIEAARERIAGLDAALARLGAGDYGRCARCGGDIGAERLAARPTATTCIACAFHPR